MRLSTLVNDYIQLAAQLDCDVSGLTLDSREVLPGNVFIALRGTQCDGKQYITHALDKGARAVLSEAHTPHIELLKGVPIIAIPNLHQKTANIAARYFAFPGKKLKLIGVTGTNGKTSCTHFIAQLLQKLNVACGVIGTLGHGFLPELSQPNLTTPDVISLQRLLAEMANQHAQVMAMEVSSHSIHQDRINGLEFDVGVFTNLTQDHLDYHGCMANYAAVKKHFLVDLSVEQVVINADDAYGQTWLTEIAKKKPVWSYGIKENTIANVIARKIKTSLTGIEAEIHSPWGKGQLILPLLGEFNLSNAIAVLTTLAVKGYDFSQLLMHFANIKPPPGRMQTLGGGKHPLIVVDYSHTPDALEKALQTLKKHVSGRITCVFGCGGNRDHSKRAEMGRIAESLADQVVITNDNPRNEDPEAIVNDIMQGIKGAEKAMIELDRSKAIQKSIQWSTNKDAILIAGKGAERYQLVKEQKIPFNDAEEVLRYLC